ncbi:MAG: PaaI family thioesterase [Pseudomonadota bacterium]
MSLPETATEREALRDATLATLTGNVPYNRFLGVRFERLGDELTARLPFEKRLIGNPFLPAIHGGVTGSFLEITALIELAWERVLVEIDAGGDALEAVRAGRFPPMPRTIDVTVDYLRSGRARDCYARARVLKPGRRVAHLQVEAWQEERARPFAMLRGNFLMPD